MTKSRKILLVVLICVLALLIIVAGVLASYVISLYSMVDYDPDASFVQTVERNDVLDRALNKLQSGVSIDEVIKDPELSAAQIDFLKAYAEDLNFDSDKDNSDVTVKPPELDPIYSKDVINILFLGTDDRSGVSGVRSDSIIVVSVNKQTKEITFTSLLRDMYIELVGYYSDGRTRYDRINTAYQFGGVKMLNDTMEKYLGIKIDNYVRVNFESFETIIDELGGVDVPFNEHKSVRDAEIKRLSKYTDFSASKQLVAGTETVYHLTGEQALRYCRDRYSGQLVGGDEDGDFGRTARQRKVLGALVERAKSMSVTELLDMMEVILPLVTTDLTLGDCTALLTSVGASYKDYKINDFRIPADQSTWRYIKINGADMIEVDYAANSKLWRERIYGK